MTTPRRQRRSWGKIRRLAHGSGRYQASYMGPDLQRHTAPYTFTTRMDAERWLSDEHRLLERDEWTPPKVRAAQKYQQGKTFHAYATGWLETRTLKPRTRQGYSELLDGPLTGLHKLPLSLLTAEVVRRWYAGLPADTPTRNSHAYQFMHTVLNTAVTDGLITANPCTIRGAMNTHAKRQAVILTPAEVAKLALAIQPGQLKALVLISAWCGLRYGEAIELRRKDISADCEVIRVARAVTHRNGCHIDTPKSGKGRTVIVPPHVVPDVRDHLAHHVGPDPEALLFTAPKSCHYASRRAGLGRCRSACEPNVNPGSSFGPQRARQSGVHRRKLAWYRQICWGRGIFGRQSTATVKLWKCPVCAAPMWLPRRRCSTCRRRNRQVGQWWP